MRIAGILAGNPVRRMFFVFITTFMVLFTPLLPAGDSGDLSNAREQFLAARQALVQDDFENFARLQASLQDYPLYPYLVFWQMERSLDSRTTASILSFVDEYKDTPLAWRMRVAWLRHLAANGRWEEYLSFYRSSRNTELRCHFHTAQMETGQEDAAWEGAARLWQVGYSQHSACDALFSAWEAAGKLSTDLRRERIELAMEQGNANLARYLTRGLPEAERDVFTRWLAIHRQPLQLLEDGLRDVSEPYRMRIALHGLMQLATTQADTADDWWPRLISRFAFDEVQRHGAAHAVALQLALNGDVRALEWYAVLPSESFNQSSRAWVVRTALRNKRWLAVKTWIEEMPATERHSDMWSYWLARAHQATGGEEEADRLFRQLSTSRSYYGFLAADTFDGEYNFNHVALPVSQDVVTALLTQAPIVRAGELYHLGLYDEAREEWRRALAGMNRQERLAAGSLAAEWQWHDRALLTLAGVGYFDDLAIRFPLAYSEMITTEAERQELDPAWIYAVARQESAMDPHARSPVGAMGLMQLMPSTGMAIARQLAVELVDRQLLLQPEINIRFGSHYLRQMLERFEHPVLATAAYNAGPHRVERWYPQQPVMDADIWIDTMPFYETREYVRRVMAYSVFYDQRLERPVQRLSERMKPVSKPDSLTVARHAEGDSSL